VFGVKESLIADVLTIDDRGGRRCLACQTHSARSRGTSCWDRFLRFDRNLLWLGNLANASRSWGSQPAGRQSRAVSCGEFFEAAE
jgi:hypothetical protein